MQHLRKGIHWRSVGQRDPLVEYRSESQKLFESLQANLRDEVLTVIFNIHEADAVVRQSQDDEYDTELTRLAENAVERGVNGLFWHKDCKLLYKCLQRYGLARRLLQFV